MWQLFTVYMSNDIGLNALLNQRLALSLSGEMPAVTGSIFDFIKAHSPKEEPAPPAESN
jgi:hypothetical protein